MVSEIVDCDSKILPDLIPSTVTEGNQSSCDITANLSTVDMDTREDDQNQSKESSLEQTVMDVSEVENDNQSEEGGQTGLVQTDINQSVEELRAEHYMGQENSNPAQESDEIIDNISTDNNVNSNNTEVNETDNNDSLQGDSSVEQSDSQEGSTNVDTIVERPLEEQSVSIQVDGTNSYDSFQYWRMPLPEVDLDVDLLQESSTDDDVLPRYTPDEQHKDLCAALSNTLDDLTVCDNLPVSVIEHSHPYGNNEIDISSIAPIVSEDGSETTMTVIDGVVQGTSRSFQS